MDTMPNLLNSPNKGFSFPVKSIQIWESNFFSHFNEITDTIIIATISLGYNKISLNFFRARGEGVITSAALSSHEVF